MEDYVTPVHHIEVDFDKCGNALPCLKCVHACIAQGQNCLVYVNTETPEVTKDWPKSLKDIPHSIRAREMMMCHGCQECVKACPKGALTFVPARAHLPRAVVPRSSYTPNCSILRDGTIVDDSYDEEIIYLDTGSAGMDNSACT